MVDSFKGETENRNRYTGALPREEMNHFRGMVLPVTFMPISHFVLTLLNQNIKIGKTFKIMKIQFLKRNENSRHEPNRTKY